MESGEDSKIKSKQIIKTYMNYIYSKICHIIFSPCPEPFGTFGPYPMQICAIFITFRAGKLQAWLIVL